ncbi:MAG TPA: KEOPS complex subunit Pcc1 [Candidatus Deferrimicrobium sp.]|nr:KEOPS complex subunit Pcc1 [Candidatus Deferrimicrobium sp.]
MEDIKAQITVKFTNHKNAESFFVSLKPETLSGFTDRSKISIVKVQDMIQFDIEAKDITAFRATLNSYLIWMRVLLSITSLCEAQNSTQKVY